MSKPHRFGVQTKAILTDLYSPEVVRAEVPGMAEAMDGVEYNRSIQDEIGILGKFTKQTGFTQDGSMQRLFGGNAALIKSLSDLHEADCNCGQPLWGRGHKAWVYEWLETSELGQALDYRAKIVV